jgi:hypothetical protein
VTASSQVALVRGMKCRPEVNGSGRREMKFPRQYADDHVRNTVEQDGLTEDVGVSATFIAVIVMLLGIATLA